MRRGAVLAAAGAVLALAAPVAAQSDPPGRVEFGAGVGWTSAHSMGSSTATLTRNAQPATTFPLFTASSELERATSFEAHVGARLLSRLWMEGHLSRATPTLRTTVSADEELTGAPSATTTISRYLVDLGLVVDLGGDGLAGGRLVPFVGGGVGYLREVLEGGSGVESGVVYHAGAGMRYLLLRRPEGVVEGLGLRGDARVLFREGGVDFENVRRTFVILSIGLIVTL